MTNEDQRDYSFTINGRRAASHVANPAVEQLLSEAGFEPADDFVLLQRTERGTRVLDCEDRVDLITGEHREFFAFDSGTTRELTVNEHSLWWGESSIDIQLIRDLARVPEEDDLVWIHVEGENEPLERTGKFSLKEGGVEHLRTHARPVKNEYVYFVDGTEYRTDQDELSGAQIVAKIANWNPQNGLVLEGEGGKPDQVIHPNNVVIFKGRETPAHFTIVPPATFGHA